jgi:hypothetical protein
MVAFGQGKLEIGCGEMVWASPTPLHEEAIAQARINNYKGRRNCLCVQNPAGKIADKAGIYPAAGFADCLAAQANNPYWLQP